MMNKRAIPSYRIVVLGGGGVGKSTLTIRFLTDNFIDEYDPTIRDSYRKQIRLEDDKPVLLDILDTAGQEEFRSMRDEWIREGDGFMLVYSITDAISFAELEDLRKEIMRAKEDKMKYIPIVMVGNKSDLKDSRTVGLDEGKQLAELWDCPLYVDYVHCVFTKYFVYTL